MADEEFHEIQLNGKQLVFLFMAGTVAAVVIFLCGLMVGRNLRSPRVETAATTADTTVTDPTRPNDQALPSPTASAESGTPVTTQETLTYSNRLEAATPPAETLNEVDPTARPADPKPPAEAKPPADRKSAATKPAPKTPVPPPSAPAAAREVPVASAPAPAAAAAEPAGNGWAVQVQAVKSRAEADTIAKRLAGKGYPAFVTQPSAGAPAFFRVRIGKYPNKRDAEAIKTRLEKEEQFKPWITR